MNNMGLVAQRSESTQFDTGKQTSFDVVPRQILKPKPYSLTKNIKVDSVGDKNLRGAIQEHREDL